LFNPEVLERVLHAGRERGEVDFGRDVLPSACKDERVYAYDFGENRVPGVREFEDRSYWRDVGTLSALAAAQQDAMGARPRFNLWNSRWPIRGEYDATLLERMRAWQTEDAANEPVSSAGSWRTGRRDRHNDERVSPS